MKKEIRLTPKNYKEYGYHYYYKIGNRFKFTIEKPSGYEEVYNDKGEYEGEFN